ncbi:peptidase S24 [Sphingomonas sp. CARO-RG-8B-R24-01]|uniref:peptidase S24 n=1 Tax=Sphingomonas sp. CARO-RG-8B-R24-01 TaxID=2914831 RepID=UPI001F5A64D4|nr:peptidase S24 [Sphingomonas sp. CARO-RG-8B-R24-01]
MSDLAIPSEVRKTLKGLAVDGRITLSALSAIINRPPRYLRAFVESDQDERLFADEIDVLAKFFMVDPSCLGAPKRWRRPKNCN